MNVIYVARWHNQLLDLWHEQEAMGLHVLHLDFHCDLRGLLIDRKKQRAHRIWDRFSDPDPGNFLTHALLMGHVASIRWVHDEPGGRRYDIGTVKYETDLSALPYRVARAFQSDSGFSISYEVIPYAHWDGLQQGEVLDIDWDFFASTEYPPGSIEPRIERFLDRAFQVIPQQTYISYSPDYSHDSEELYRQFIDLLAGKFQADVIELNPNEEMVAAAISQEGDESSPLHRLARRTYHATNRELRKRGIY